MRAKFCFLGFGEDASDEIEFEKDIPCEEGNLEPIVEFVVPEYSGGNSKIFEVVRLVFEFDDWVQDSNGKIIPKFTFAGVKL